MNNMNINRLTGSWLQVVYSLVLLTFFVVGPTYAQSNETVSGTVTDAETGETVPGVNIMVKGTTTGTSTDAEGAFELTVPSLNDTLIFSFIGYQTQEVPINGRTGLDVSLQSQTVSGEEVVVVGYGSQKESDLTGSVGSVKSEELLERPAINVEQSLSGKISGVNVSTNSGRPGGDTRIRIRGYGSINASNNPLYVVDGVVMPNGISSLNPNNIESIEVLKDASATAIYGTRGSNGVIMVTTKRGQAGKSTLSYDTHVSVSQMARKQDLLSSEQFLAVEDLAYKNAEKFDPTGFENGRYTDPEEKRQNLVGVLFDENLDPLYDVDWQDAVTRNAISQSHNLSYSGGNQQTTYSLSLGYADENGVIKNTFLNRTDIRGALDSDVNDWLRMGGTISYSSSKRRLGSFFTGANNVPRMMIEMIPIVPYKYQDGSYGIRTDYPGMEGGDNPLAQLHEVDRRQKWNDFNGNAYLTVSPAENLEFTSRFGVNLRNQRNPYFASSRVSFEGMGRNYSEIAGNESTFWQWSNHLNHSLTLNENHSFYTTVGAELQESEYLGWNTSTRDMPDDFYKWYNLGAGENPNAPSSSYSGWQMASYFARVNYNFQEKYLLTVTGRADGSSRFGADNKYAFFPSAALAWRASEEDFLSDIEFINNLKFRVSYGTTGNSQIGEYQSLANLRTNTAIFNGTRSSGTVISTLANPQLQWEKTDQLDIGFDLGLFNDRVEVQADYFWKKTRDLLLGAPVPSSSGYTSMTRNIGSMKNQGVELVLNTANVQTNDVVWNTSFNFSYIQNKVTSLGVNDEDIFPGPWFLGQTNILRVGEPVGSFWGLTRVGTWNTDEAAEAAEYGKLPGDLKFKDLNNDGQINSSDYSIIGKGTPDFYGSLSNTLGYKNFQLTLELQYMYGHDVYKLTEHSSLDRTGIANSYSEVLNAWTPENQNTPIAQIRPTSAGYDSFLDSHKVKDGSFLRGKNLMLAYNLPSSVLAGFGLQNVRVYGSMQNFFLLTKYDGYDPETTTYGDQFSQGIQFHDYPKSRTLTFGLNVSF